MRDWLNMLRKNKNKSSASPYDWCKIIFPFIGMLAASGIGAYYTYETARNNNAKEYIEIGLSIINSPESKDNEKLREWALDLINNYAPIELEAELKRNIIEGTAFPTDNPLNKYLSELEGALYQNELMYTFVWEDTGSNAYSFTIERKLNDEWVFYNGISTPKANVEMKIPRNGKIRWKVTEFSYNGEASTSTDWKYIDLDY